MHYHYLYTLKDIKRDKKSRNLDFSHQAHSCIATFHNNISRFKSRCLKVLGGMVHCKHTELYAPLAYSRVFLSIYADVKASKTRRVKLFSPCKWKVALPKDERGCNRESTGSLSAVCSDESKGEFLKALACPLREQLICECFTGIFIPRNMRTVWYKKSECIVVK